MGLLFCQPLTLRHSARLIKRAFSPSGKRLETARILIGIALTAASQFRVAAPERPDFELDLSRTRTAEDVAAKMYEAVPSDFD